MHLEDADATLDRGVSEASACPTEGSTGLVDFSILRLVAEASLMRHDLPRDVRNIFYEKLYCTVSLVFE